MQKLKTHCNAPLSPSNSRIPNTVFIYTFMVCHLVLFLCLHHDILMYLKVKPAMLKWITWEKIIGKDSKGGEGDGGEGMIPSPYKSISWGKDQ